MDKYKQKATEALGMKPSTASSILKRKLLFSFVKELHGDCYVCNEPLTESSFVRCHKSQWLDSKDPLFLYFNPNNIAFKHKNCKHQDLTGLVGNRISRGQEQLGMTRSSASARLNKIVLFNFVIRSGNKCHRCGGDLDIDSLSIDHKEDWLNSLNPREVFFDIENIAFSHLSCNAKAGEKKSPQACPSVASYRRGCRCDECRCSYSSYRKEVGF